MAKSRSLFSQKSSIVDVRVGSVITSLLRMAATSYVIDMIHYQGLSFTNTMQQSEMSYSNPRNLLHHVVFKLQVSFYADD